MNRKLKKLLRSPKRFFLDSRPLRWIWWISDLLLPRLKNQGSVFQSFSAPSALSDVKPLDLYIPGLEKFVLFGENWLNAPEKPIALLWGFNPWKRNFVSRYLHEYRTAFIPGKMSWFRQKWALKRLEHVHIIIWGMKEPRQLLDYARSRNLPVFRMEDGFLRSCTLGSQHSMPLSLVLDDEGIYFDATRPSRLERLLNEHDFTSTPELLAASHTLLKIMRGLGISKYNLGSLRKACDLLGPRIKRRILVLGQVEDDASIRFGLAEGWTNRRLIELAREENPNAEILYKVHPDVAKRFRSNKHAIEELSTLCRVISADIKLADLLKEVDHVYTITSLSGFEALIHGLPVTVVGAPFYAGWGLTDDRVAILRRNRRRSLEEIFCIAYLLYPRYVADVSDPVRGCLATLMRLAAEHRQALDRQDKVALAKEKPQVLLSSDYWSVALHDDILPRLLKNYGKNLHKLFNMPRVFSACHGDHFQLALASMIVGKLRRTKALGRVLGAIRACIRPMNFTKLLADLWDAEPSAIVLDHWAAHCERLGRMDEAGEALSYITSIPDYPNPAPQKSLIPTKQYGYTLKRALFALRQRRLEEAYELFCRLLISGHLHAEVLAGIAEVARLRFDFSSASALFKIINQYAPGWRSGYGFIQEAKVSSLSENWVATLEASAQACIVNIQHILTLPAFSGVLEKRLGALPYQDAGLASGKLSEKIDRLTYARALVAVERFADAEAMLFEWNPPKEQTELYLIVLSQAYSYQGKVEEAVSMMKRALEFSPTISLYKEALRLSIIANNYTWGEELLESAKSRGFNVGDIFHRKIALGRGQLQEGYLSFRKTKTTKLFQIHFDDRYIQSVADTSSERDLRILIIAYFGPGDEIRFSSFYRKMKNALKAHKVSFTCDPRLHPLLTCSFPDMTFYPVARVRSLDWLSDYKEFNHLPDCDLHAFFDNTGWELAQSVDRVALVTDLLGDVMGGYETFSGKPYLKPAPERVAAWRQRLALLQGQPLVGLSWRSSLTTYSRNEHYLSIEDIAPLLEVEGVRFVNLQYDEYDTELTWLERRFPGRVVHFDDLDQFNDLENVAALMTCLDLVIAPATTVVELAGALGCPTLLLSNSSELHWRKRPGTTTDVWHSSVTHVEGTILGDKASLAQAIKEALMQFVTTHTEKTIVTDVQDIA